MKYLVIEIQKSSDGTIAVPPIATFDTYFDAAARYHQILSVAAISEVPVHTALILTDVGQEIALDTFNHVDVTVE